MPLIEKTVFICYRRTNAPWALAIYQDLTHHGYDVFFDFNGIASGDFESVIIGNIRARAHFIVLLTPSALERCGEPEDWLPSKMELIAQRDGPLGDRLSGAIEDLFARLALPVLVIGMDTPQLRTAHLEGAAKALLAPGTDTVLGPAEDGGYWLIGTRRPVVSMFSGVEMSTARTGRQQLSQLRALGLHCARLGRLRDVDLLSDALAVAQDVPGSRFAAAIDELVTSPPRSRCLESVVGE